ncbi:MAG: nucleoside hydrolase [Oscillochloris sp.]|nr:nucleoside hydrolase [Oscillochloris sp.]
MRQYRYFLVFICAALIVFGLAAYPAAARTSSAPAVFFVDTDIGVDDAVAIAWLMEQPRAEILGFTTVAGNTSNEHAARNLLTLFAAAERQYPVTIGASAPLELPATRTGALIHGPDGLWFNQNPTIDIGGLPGDAPAALAAAAAANPDLTIIALGPLTNIALAVQQYPAEMAGVRLVALGGARHGGNSTPVAEFNIYADPHALEVVLAGGMQLELVTLDAFDQVQVDVEKFPARLAQRGGAVGQLLAPALSGYFAVQQAAGPVKAAAIPDVAAVFYALYPQYGEARSALIDVVTVDDVTRGQTIIGLDIADRVPMIADDAELSALADQAFLPGFDLNAALFAILVREPDNAQVILDVHERTIVRQLERALTR